MAIAPKNKVSSKVAAKPVLSGKPAEKAAEKANRVALIESLVAELVPHMKEHAEAVERSSSLLFQIADDLTALVNDNDLTEKEARTLVINSIAEANEVEAEEITMEGNPTLYSNVSKILRLAIPVDAKAGKELAKARAKGVTVANALEIARGKKTASAVKASAGKGKNPDGTKAAKKSDTFDGVEEWGNAVSALIGRGQKSGITIEEMEEQFASLLAEYSEAAEADEDGSED